MDARETTQYSSGNLAENRRIQFPHEHIRLPKIQSKTTKVHTLAALSYIMELIK